MVDDKLGSVIRRIQEGLEAARHVLKRYEGVAVQTEYKSGDDPVTAADRAVNVILHRVLLRNGEGWLSEESADDLTRLGKDRVWIVDPLDGTREFVAGIPEWCVSIASVERGRATASGILNPSTGETFVGAVGTGVLRNGERVRASSRDSLDGALVLASRSEVRRGEWDQFQKSGPFKIQPMGSVAHKLACVATGLADATWTLTPKHEWDVAAGVALVEAAGGFAAGLTESRLTFNQKATLIPGLLACGPGLSQSILSFIRTSIHAERSDSQ